MLLGSALRRWGVADCVGGGAIADRLPKPQLETIDRPCARGDALGPVGEFLARDRSGDGDTQWEFQTIAHSFATAGLKL
jgi:hypothetical protein